MIRTVRQAQVRKDMIPASAQWVPVTPMIHIGYGDSFCKSFTYIPIVRLYIDDIIRKYKIFLDMYKKWHTKLMISP